MEQVSVISKRDGDRFSGWVFMVEVGTPPDTTRHEVSVEAAHAQELTSGRVDPEELVRESLAFLLAREPKESILSSFNLHDITTYFPQYERIMREKYGGSHHN